jgi:hypothetical protein
MNVFISGNVVESTIALNDDAGNPIADVVGVTYRVIDSENNELVKPTVYVPNGEDYPEETEEPTEPETPETPEEALTDEPEQEEPSEPVEEETISEVIVQTSEEVNTLKEETSRDIRIICLKAKTRSGAVFSLEYAYGLTIADPLTVGVNSFMTYRQAQKMAMDMPKLNNWESMSQSQRISALLEAKQRICRLAFDFGQVQLDMTKQDYVVQAAGKPRCVQVGEIFGVYGGSVKLEDLSVEDFEALPTKFRTALMQAQLAEANDVLEVDSIAERRRQGLILETIGEVKQMFSSIIPAQMAVSSKAMSYLSRYLASGKKIGRS